ncbi:DNA replication initiation control protein YabA [Streptococcus urinalis]
MFDAFDGLSQNLLVTLADIEALKKQVQSLVEENTTLRLENMKLRDRLSRHDHENHVKVSPGQGKVHLEGIYDEGFHICNDFYGQRRENDEDCIFCRELLDRK